LDREFINWLMSRRELILNKDLDILKQMIVKSCAIKESVIFEDEFEQGYREILNFGHTVAHAVELATDYGLLHGEAVAIGMVIESYIAYQMGYLALEQVHHLILILKSFQLPITNVCLEKQECILKHMQSDKKNKQNHPHMVLLTEFGECLNADSKLSFAIPEHMIRQALIWGSQLC
jgi:3-dehydroquinate synthase